MSEGVTERPAMGRAVLLTGGERRLIAVALESACNLWRAVAKTSSDKEERRVAGLRLRQCRRIADKLNRPQPKDETR